jgi:hypothetical protein
LKYSAAAYSREVQMDNDTHIVIEDTGEAVDFMSPSTSPEALKRAAAYLRRQSEKPPDPRFPAPPQPEPARANISVEDLLVRRIDEPYDEQASRTNQARAQILVALEREKQETEQQRQQARADARAKVRQTALGRLLGDTRHG